MPAPPSELPADPPSVSPEAYRRVMQHWPSGVTVVTVRHGSIRHGMTASAFTSVSIDPPLILVVVDRRWRSHEYISAANVFCVNILSDDQVELADRFAGRHGDIPDRFFDLQVTTAATGSPVIDAALGHLDCTLDAVHNAGDHSIFIGRVVDADVHRPFGTRPLLYHAQRYARVESPPPA